VDQSLKTGLFVFFVARLVWTGQKYLATNVHELLEISVGFKVLAG